MRAGRTKRRRAGAQSPVWSPNHDAWKMDGSGLSQYTPDGACHA